MKEFYGYFNSVEGDVREYVDKELAEIFKAGFTNGVENEQALRVESVPASMKVRVNAGRAIIEGFVYSLEDDGSEVMQLNINPAGSAGRIDTVVLRLDMDTRKILLAVIDGEPASAPKPKEPTRQGSIYELVLAHLNIEPNKAEVTDIKDTRADEGLCGYICASGLTRGEVEDLLNKVTAKAAANSDEIANIKAKAISDKEELEQEIKLKVEEINKKQAEQDSLISANADAIAKKTNKRFVFEIGVQDWHETENAGVFKAVSYVSGVAARKTGVIDLIHSGTAELEFLENEAYSLIYKAQTGDNIITAFALDKPKVALKIQYIELADEVE